MKLKTVLAAFAGLAMTATAASAAVTETIWFDDLERGLQATGVALDYTSSTGVTLDATGHALTAVGGIGGALRIGEYDRGLGITSNDWFDDHQVDGLGTDEIVKLSFGQTVKIDRVYFSYASDSCYVIFTCNDSFAFKMIDGENSGSYYASTEIENGFSYTFNSEWVGTMFGIGATGHSDEWKLKGVKYTYEPSVVPLPASSLLLLGGLGGLVAMRRRKKAA